jgi:aminopeptidase N
MNRKLAVLVATVAFLGVAPGPAFADEDDDSDGAPGAPGIGDPYYPLDGNGGYDVQHYDLEVRYDPPTDVLTGVATVEARATEELSSLNLDFEGLTVSSVTVDSADATWSQDGGELTITPQDELDEDEAFSAVVSYEGVPKTIDPGSGFLHTDDGALAIGQPDVAATWFPSNDHPRDAASVSVEATVPEGLEAISNGVLEELDTEGGWSTWEWRAEEPMATYLVTLAIGEFDVREYEANGLLFWDALDPDLATLDLDPETTDDPPPLVAAEAALARQPEILEFLSGYFGPYPFEAAGGVVDDARELQFALETQTRPVYSPFFFTDRVSGELVVVHEYAHQWYGDLLRLDRWKDIWLNEGFATYAEWLWLEHEGLSTPQAEFEFIAARAAEVIPEFWTVVIGDPGPAQEQLFHAAVYYRGAMTLHALRLTVGDPVFFDILEEWAASQAGDTVTTDEFITLSESLSGMELDELFQTWLYTPEKPAGLPETAPDPAA